MIFPAFIDTILWASGLISPKYTLREKSKLCRSEAIDSVKLKLTHDITKAIWLVLFSQKGFATDYVQAL